MLEIYVSKQTLGKSAGYIGSVKYGAPFLAQPV